MLSCPCIIKQFVQLFINALIVWIVSECTDMNGIKTGNAQQANDVYHYKNTKEKLYKN
jgi:hypothetical protein